MDRYNRAYIAEPSHDDFYTKPSILSAFKNYIANVVPRYANSSAVLGWELANDPRCSSTLPGSSTCNTTTITKWVADICMCLIWLPVTLQIVKYSDSGLYQEFR
jgi:mannan endo-1,4-beta-mannosidase